MFVVVVFSFRGGVNFLVFSHQTVASFISLTSFAINMEAAVIVLVAVKLMFFTLTKEICLGF